MLAFPDSREKARDETSTFLQLVTIFTLDESQMIDDAVKFLGLCMFRYHPDKLITNFGKGPKFRSGVSSEKNVTH